MKTLGIAFLIHLTAALAPAQTFTVRGEVESNDGANLRLESTRVRLDSSSVNLAALEDRGYYRFTVENDGTAGAPALNVLNATRDFERFAMEPLVIGRTTDFEVRGPQGALGFVFVDLPSNTGVTVLPGIGGWLLSPGALSLGAVQVRANGEGDLRVAIPDAPALVGTRFNGQAAVVNGGSVVLTNPDAATVVGRD